MNPSYQHYATHDESEYPELWDGCVGAWAPCLGPSGERLHDLSGRSNFGTLTNMDPATDWVVSNGRYALNFDGNNDEVLFSSKFSTMPFSVSLWANIASPDKNNCVFGIASNASVNPFFLVYFRGDLPGDPIHAVMRGSNVSSNTQAVGPVGYIVNRWYHIVAVFRSATYRQIFVNGVAGTPDTTWHSVESLNRMSIGSLPRASSVAFAEAMIDDVMIFSRDLPPHEIALLATSRGIAYSPRRRRKAYSFGPTFSPAWARGANQFIQPSMIGVA